MDLKTFQWRSLKTRVTIFALAIFLISNGALALYVSRMHRDDMQRQMGEQQFATVSLVAAEVDYELNDRLGILEKTAEYVSPALSDTNLSAQSRLEGQVLQGQFNGGVVVYRPDGAVIANTLRATGTQGVDYLDAEHLAAVLKQGKSTIGRPFMDNQRQAPIFAMTVPIRDAQGNVKGAMVGLTDLSKPNFLEKFAGYRYGKSGYYFIEEPTGRSIITGRGSDRTHKPHTDPGIRWLADHHGQTEISSRVVVGPMGEEMLISVKRIPVADWLIVAVLPTEEAFAAIDDLQRRMLSAAFFLTLLAGGLVWWMLKRQLEPMFKAVKTLSSLPALNHYPQPLAISRQDEIGELIGGFNQLLAQLRQRDEALRESEQRLRAIFENEPECIKILDAQGRLIEMNPAGLAMIEVDSFEQVKGRSLLDLIVPEYRSSFLDLHARVLSGEAMQMSFEVIGLKGARRWLETHAVPMQYQGETVHLAVTHDITERKKSEESLTLAASVFFNAREGIMIADAKGQILEVNDTFSRITGYSREAVVGRNPRMLSSGRQSKAFYAELWRSVTEEGHWSGEVWNRRRNGEVYAEILTISAVYDSQGNIWRYVGLFTDITTLKEHERRLEHIVHYDALTMLPNRVLLADRLHQAMVQAQRRDKHLAVVCLDLDGFKVINDQHGHNVGDQLLVTLAGNMQHVLREGDTLARLGGDEFVAVLMDLADIEASIPMLSRLLSSAAAPVHLGGKVVQVSASLGVTFYPQKGEVDADQLLRQADQAMYQAKLTGKNRFHVFDDEQDRSIRGYHEDQEQIRRAFAEREFVLYYQPKVNMRSGMVIGAEALIRWQHPEKGLLPPAAFLPMIEDHPMTIALGEWVINTALTQLELWRSSGLDIPVSVNVDARHLQREDFVDHLREILAAHPTVKPGDLMLEVLETSALDDMVGVGKVIESCRDIGVMFALDDFGTGYSSLTYLKNLQVTEVKIDQSFVRGMLDDPDDLAILEGVIGLSTAFRRKVIAEGVETIEHGTMLLKLGCELAQGYGIARPMPAEKLPAWAMTWRPDPIWEKQRLVSRVDLPLIFASVEHRAWIVTMENYLMDQRVSPPPLDHHHCRFGKWLDTGGLASHGAKPAIQDIEPLHLRLHALAEEMCELKAQDRGRDALARLDEFHGLRDALLERLAALELTNLQLRTISPEAKEIEHELVQ